MTKIQPEDYKFVPVDPDPNFDADKNKEVIEGVIRDTEKIAKKKKREAYEGIDERAEAMAQFLKSADKGGKTSNVAKYFGRKELARLRGESLIKNEKFREALEEWRKGKKKPVDLSEE